MARGRRSRTRTLHKADRATAVTAAGATVFTPQQVAAIAQAIAGQGSPTAPVTALPRQPGLLTVPFGPGVPLTPAAINPARPDSGRPEPRAYEYAVTSNLPGVNDKLVPWPVLRQAADGVSIFRKCIEIRKNEFSSLEWDVVVSKKAITRALHTSAGTPRADLEQQMQTKLAPDIARISDFWMEPDRRNGHSWIEWIKKALEERFVLDALAIYPRHTHAGDLYSFEILDGSTIKPLLDADGGRPMPPSAAFQQILWGFPRGEFVADLGEDGLPDGVYPADQLIYEVDNVRSWTPYGCSATERALSDGALYVQRNAWQLAEYTDGVMPSGWLLAGEGQADWTSDQLQEYERLLNDYYAGITAARQRLRILPFGMEPHESASVAEKYKPDYDLYLLKLCAGHYETTIAELGFTEPGGLGSTGYHEGQADVQDRKATKPTVAAVQALLNKLSRRHLGMPAELEIKFAGHEPEDLAAEDEIADRQLKSGRRTLNEDRDRLGLARYTFPEANKPFVMGGTGGITFLEGAEAAAAAAQQQAQQIADAKANPAPPGDGPSGAEGPDGTPDDKPNGPAGGGGELNKIDDADLIKAEVTAYARWARRNPNPRRPFTVQYAQPIDFASANPSTLEFDEWVWEPDALGKADFTPSLHPRDAKGRFRKRTMSELAYFLEGKHGKDRSKWPPRSRKAMETAEAEHHATAAHADPRVRTARGRQERIDTARKIGEMAAEVEEMHGNGNDLAVMKRRIANMAGRHGEGDSALLATTLAGAQTPDEMLETSRRWATEHHLEPVGNVGDVETLDYARHHVPSFLRDEGLDTGSQVKIVKPGFAHTDPETGERVVLSKPAADFPDLELGRDMPPAPAKPARSRTPHKPKAAPPAVREEPKPAEVELDDVAKVRYETARQELIHMHALEQRTARERDPGYELHGGYEPTDEEIRSRMEGKDRRAFGTPDLPLEGELEGDTAGPDIDPAEAAKLREFAERFGGAPAQGAPSTENALGQQGPADRLRQAEVMYGSDRSKWPASARRAAARLERDQARQRALPAAPEPSEVVEGEVVDLHPQPGTPAAGSVQLAEPEVVDGELPTRETTIPIGRDSRARLSDAGKARATEPARPSGLLRPDFSADPDKVSAALAAAPSRTEGERVLGQLNLKAAELRQLAKDMGVPVKSKATKKDIHDAIIGVKVGRRVDADAIMRSSAHSPAAKKRAEDEGLWRDQAITAATTEGITPEQLRGHVRAAEAHFGHDRSTWDAKTRRDAEMLERDAGKLERSLASAPTSAAQREAQQELDRTIARYEDLYGNDRGEWPGSAYSTILALESHGAKQRTRHPATPEGVAAAFYDAMQGQDPSGWLSLDHLRPHLGGTREEQDTALLEGARARDFHLIPEEIQHSIPESKQRAAVKIGGENKHLIGIHRGARLHRETEGATPSATADQHRMAAAQKELALIQSEIDNDNEAGGALDRRHRNQLEDRKEALRQELDDIAARRMRKADEPDPKASTPPDQRWPAWAVDTAIAAAYAAPIVAAMAGGLTTLAAAQHLAEQWLAASAARPGLGAATWLEEQGWDVGPALTAVLDDLYTEAAYVGQQSALAAIETPARMAVSLDVDWGRWTPGDVDAARQLYTGQRLQALLGRFGIVIRSVAQHRLDELAQILAQGLADGDGPEELARKIRHLTGSADQAYRIAVTETARALSAAAVDEYDQAGIASKGWMNASDQRVCQLCQDNEDAGDIPLEDLFPSGEPFPPAHPHCRCAIIPGLDEEGA